MSADSDVFRGFGLSQDQIFGLRQSARAAEKSHEGKERFIAELNDKISSMAPTSLAREQLTQFVKSYSAAEATL